MSVRTTFLAGILAVGSFALLWQLTNGRDVHAPAAAPSQAAASIPSGAAPSSAEPSAGIASLAAQLEAERAAREALAGEVASLRADVERLSSGVASSMPAAPPALPPGHPAAAPGAAPAADFDTRALVDAGFDEREAQQLRARTEELDLERLYLRDRAVREGWANTPRFLEESRALDARGRALREELGDERYDWLLFASGQSNRVMVQSVMERSPAASAGIRPGDAIVSYGGARLFDASSLRDATTQGKPAETVPVEIVRDGETQRLFVARGPLGVRLEEARLRPVGPVRP